MSPLILILVSTNLLSKEPGGKEIELPITPYSSINQNQRDKSETSNLLRMQSFLTRRDSKLLNHFCSTPKF